MDAEPLREFSDGCEECDRIAGNTEEDAAAGLDYEGGELSITEFTEPLVTGLTAEMAFRVDQAPLDVLDAGGAVSEELSSQAFVRLSSSAVVRWEAAQQAWVMSGLTLG
jgi:hypothetical protein